MIKNADLYDLINLSLRANELENNETVENFIQKALDKSNSSSNVLRPRTNRMQQSESLKLLQP